MNTVITIYGVEMYTMISNLDPKYSKEEKTEKEASNYHQNSHVK